VDAIFIHGRHSLVNVEGGGRHVVEAPRVKVSAVAFLTFAEASGPGIALEGNRIEPPLPFPPFDPGLARHHPRREVPVLRVDVVDEGMRRFHDMVVHRDELHVGPQHDDPSLEVNCC
jgi:hypothetical protein